MSRRKAAKAKATRQARARAKAAQVARSQAVEAKALVSESAPKSRLRRVFSLRMAREAVLTTGAILGVICMLFAIAAFAFDVKPVVFRSGSMAPAIDTGALAISKHIDAKDIAVGDVVTVKNKGVRITHRVQSVSMVGDEATLILKGDANSVSDDHAYVVKSSERVLFHVPKVGYAVAWASGPVGVFVGGFLVGLLVLVAFGPGSRSAGVRKPTAALAMIALGVCGAGAAESQQTLARFTDTATLTSGTVSSYSIPAPSGVTCVNPNGNKLKLDWTWSVAGSANPRIKFQIRTNPTPNAQLGTPLDIAKTARTFTSGNLSTTGQIWIVAVHRSATGTVDWISPDSQKFTFNFTGNNKTCV